ncbi:heavy-metal-associated domain-containing protein [Arthrobacter sp. NamB2]|uniref:heavy-metal-associated domain-containing protein n=1 Tax=Arthrobacter sp. NamB2 TaxID=2576035 RepID=UPI0010C970B5|nr:heavy-metal-associated domain-containing protein [Arthrobacter sp. NamB2]TKV28507.1 heavy-metal-associated domain-containing protein [Arthrobacter sp. NamB2]
MTDTVRTPINLTDVSGNQNSDATPSAEGSCGCCAPQQATAAQPATEGTVSADYSVTGLTCGSCAGRVSSAIGALDGVENVQIALVPGGVSTVSVTSNQRLDASSIRDAVEKAGYQLTTA